MLLFVLAIGWTSILPAPPAPAAGDDLPSLSKPRPEAARAIVERPWAMIRAAKDDSQSRLPGHDAAIPPAPPATPSVTLHVATPLPPAAPSGAPAAGDDRARGPPSAAT